MAGTEKKRKIEENGVSSKKPEEEKTDNPLLKRWFVFDGDIPQSGAENSFSIVSYNILADCHAQKDYNNNENNNNNINIEKYWIALDYRHKKIMEELNHWNSDLICLQEVGEDHYQVLEKELAGLGYRGFWVGRRWEQVGLREGCGTFYKTSSFELLSSEGVFLQDAIWENIGNSKGNIEKIYKELKGSKDSGSFEFLMTSLKETVKSHVVTAIAVLKRRTSGSILVVGNIHVCWDWLVRPDKQVLQVLQAIEEMSKISKKTLKNSNNNNNNKILHHHIICGDFNSIPTDPLHNIICRENKEKCLCEKDKKMLSKIQCVKDGPDDDAFSLLQLLPHLFKAPSSLFTSAYQQVQGYNPDSTHSRALDYIYYRNHYGNEQAEDADNISKSVKVLMTPRLPSDTIIPSPTFPSDHLLIMAAMHDPS